VALTLSTGLTLGLILAAVELVALVAGVPFSQRAALRRAPDVARFLVAVQDPEAALLMRSDSDR
jgi:hypothetical protein